MCSSEAHSCRGLSSPVYGSASGGVEWAVLHVHPSCLSHWGSFFASSVADLSGRSWSFPLMTVPQSCDAGVLTGPYALPFGPLQPGRENFALTDTGQPPPGSH